MDSFEIETKPDCTINYSTGFKNILKYAIPSVGGMILRNTVDLLGLIVIGRLGNPDLTSAFGLTYVISTVVTFSLGVGLGGGVETLSSQAFGSGKNYLAGGYYNRAQVILTTMFVVQAVIMLFTEPILVFLGQPEIPAYYAGLYVKVSLPSIWAYCQGELMRRYLGTQGAFYIITNSQLVCGVLHPFWLYFFVYYLELSFVGVALAGNVTQLLIYFGPILYIRVKKNAVKEDSWFCINRDSFKGIREYLAYGLPAAAMTFFEFGTYEIVSLMAGLLGTIALGTNAIVFNILGIMYMVISGISLAGSTLIGNSLGASKPQDAKIYSNIGISISGIFAVFSGVVIYTFRFTLASIFSNDPELVASVADTLPIMLVPILADDIQGMSQGIIKAMGFQKYASYLGLIGFYAISIPAAYFLSGTYGIKGIWVGISIGAFFVAFSYLYLIYSADFRKISNEASERIQIEAKETEFGAKLVKDLLNSELSGNEQDSASDALV